MGVWDTISSALGDTPQLGFASDSGAYSGIPQGSQGGADTFTQDALDFGQSAQKAYGASTAGDAAGVQQALANIALEGQNIKQQNAAYEASLWYNRLYNSVAGVWNGYVFPHIEMWGLVIFGALAVLVYIGRSKE